MPGLWVGWFVTTQWQNDPGEPGTPSVLPGQDVEAVADKVQTDTHVFHPPDRAATEGSLSLVRAVVESSNFCTGGSDPVSSQVIAWVPFQQAPSRQ